MLILSFHSYDKQVAVLTQNEDILNDNKDKYLIIFYEDGKVEKF